MCAAAVLGLMEFCPAAVLPSGDDARFNEAVLVLTGESEIENVDEYEMDRYLKLMSSPLRQAGIAVLGASDSVSGGFIDRLQGQERACDVIFRAGFD